MRVLIEVIFPLEPFNQFVRDGSIGQKIQHILDTIKPESVYFTEVEGHRAAFIVLDLAEPSRIPTLAEPWFLTFEAELKLRVLMTAQDLQNAGLAELGKQWA